MKVEMVYRPESKSADIINVTTGTVLRADVPLRDVARVLSEIRSEIAKARKAGK